MIYQDLIFIHIPRTGGTSIEKSFGLTLGNEEKHLSAAELREKAGPEKWAQSFVFSFVRNPWDRIISLYHQPYFRNKTNLTQYGLAYFIENYTPPEWEKRFYHEYLNTSEIDFIGRFEQRRQDLFRLQQLTGVNFDQSIQERKTNRNPNYRIYYNDQTAQMVFDRYQSDILKYNYKF